MRHRLFPCILLLAVTTACQDAPLAPPSPATPRFAVASAGTDLRSGYDYLCALRGGSIVCFGERDEGQPIGAHRAATGTFVQVTAGATHACGLRTDGAVQCWGANDYGRAPPLRRAATGSFTAVSAGLSHTCAVRTDGTVECWGWNIYGQAPPLTAPRTGRFTVVSASANSTCALRTDGVVECWGIRQAAPPVRTAPSGTYVKLGDAVGNTNCALTGTGVADCWGYLAGFHEGPYVQVAAGAGHLCALRAGGVADCWGYPLSWEGPDERSLRGRTWTRITAGSYHTCGLRADGYFECFGVQSMGSDAPDVVPAAVTPASSLRSLAWIRVQWPDLNSNEQRTEIERSVAGPGREPTTWTRIGSIQANGGIFSDSVPAGATYVHRVRVCNGAGCSAWTLSNPTAFPAAVPPAPTGAAAAGYTCSFASCAGVTWAADNTFVETIRLQRRVNPGSGYGAWQEMARQSRTATRYDDYGLTPGASYQYRVRACNARGCSAYGTSSPIVAPAPPPPAAPATLSAAAMGSYMHVVWGDVADETTYELQRRQHDGTAYGPWSEPMVRTMNVTTHEDPVVPGTLYQYRIRACNPGGCSAYTSSPPARG